MAGVAVGVDKLFYALVTHDNTAGAQYSAPVAIVGLTEITVKAASDTATLYADNAAYAVSSALGEITVDLSVASLSIETYAALMGHTVAGGVMPANSADSAPYLALGFRGQKDNGKYRYGWLLKGQFAEPADTFKTKADKVEFQPQALSGKFVARTYDGRWKMIADDEGSGWNANTAANWFEASTINSGS